jgi:SH3 domain-containing protein
MAPRPVRSSVTDVESERPRLGHLSGIVAVCFGAGLLWPLFAGLELTPRPPGSEAREHAAAALAAAAADPTNGALGADAEGEAEEAEEPPPAPLSDRQLALVKQAEVASCKDARGKPVVHCDRPLVRDVVEQPLTRLAQCGAAQSARGTLSLGLQIDFKRRRVTGVKAGDATTLPRDKVKALVACARSELADVSLKDIAHEQAEYWMYFGVELLPPGSRLEPSAEAANGGDDTSIVEASGYATVGWNTAMVREEPRADGAIAARLLFGTRVRVTGRLGDWYRVSYDAKGRIGWVHKNEVGM